MPESQTGSAEAPAPEKGTTDASEETKRLIDQTASELGKVLFPEDDAGTSHAEKLVDALVREVLEGKLVKGDIYKRIDLAVGRLDKRLTDQVNAIIHHPDFRTLEGAWRGLEYLVKSKPPGQHIKVRVMNISKKELGGVLEKFSAESGQTAWDQSPIFKQVYTNRFDMPGTGEADPFGCLIGDFQFDRIPPDVNLLKRLSAVCGAAHVPFVTAASHKLLGLESWQKLPDPAELEAKMSTPDYAAWNSLRQMDDSRYLALTMPRFLARMPYGVEKNPVDGFAFEEDMRPVPGAEWAAKETKHDNYCWANSAYAMAANIANAFHETAFTVAIRGVEGGGKVEGLPIDTFPTDDGGMDAKCPAEVAISQRRESELGRLGFMPLSHWVGTDYAAFVGAQTVQKPQQYDDPRATENSELSARLPYVFLVSRFAHYLKKMIYDWVGTNKEKAQLTEELNRWIKTYTSDPSSAEDVKRRLPLADARIDVEEVEGRPGYYQAKAYLRPHIQLEGVEVDLGVVSRMPTGA
jgi:type VI secretion system protein ImpC